MQVMTLPRLDGRPTIYVMNPSPTHPETDSEHAAPVASPTHPETESDHAALVASPTDPETESDHAALADALAAVGDRWTLLVVAALLEGPRRFGDLQQAVGGIAPNVLTQRLRQLERNALVITRPYSERPPRFVYELSAAGQELAGVLRLLAGWGARNSEAASVPRHGVCGSPMEARWWCPTCERPVGDDDEELHIL